MPVIECGSLSLEQQGKLMTEIDDLRKCEGDDCAKARAKELIDFIYALERHHFIASDKRCRYMQGIEDAMDRRRVRQEELL